jgi:transposase-like protein
MPRRGGTNEEIIHALHQVEGGEKVTEVCRRLGISEQTFYRWKKQFAGLGLSELRSLRHEKQQVEAGRRGPDARSAHPPGDRTKKAVKPRARCTLAELAPGRGAHSGA